MKNYVQAALASTVAATSYAECGIPKESIMTDLHFMHMIGQVGVREVFRGLYRANEPVVSEDCLGDWMGPLYAEILEQTNVITNDPLAVSLDAYTTLAGKATELVFRNKDACDVSPIIDDWMANCLDDIDTCYSLNGLEARITDNAVDIITMVEEMYDLSV